MSTKAELKLVENTGAQRVLTLSRDYSATRINAIINNPEVRSSVLAQSEKDLDLTGILMNANNVALMSDSGGLLFVMLAPGVYDVHTQFLVSARGAIALRLTREAVRWMMTRSDCVELWTKVPEENKPALGLTRALGGRKEFTSPAFAGFSNISHYRLDYLAWSQGDLEARRAGEWFHEMLEAKLAKTGIEEPVHADDPSHNAAVGAVVLGLRHGSVDKSLALYNRWAAISGYAPISLIARWPLTLDIQTAIVVCDERLEGFEVLRRPG